MVRNHCVYYSLRRGGTSFQLTCGITGGNPCLRCSSLDRDCIYLGGSRRHTTVSTEPPGPTDAVASSSNLDHVVTSATDPTIITSTVDSLLSLHMMTGTMSNGSPDLTLSFDPAQTQPMDTSHDGYSSVGSSSSKGSVDYSVRRTAANVIFSYSSLNRQKPASIQLTTNTPFPEVLGKSSISQWNTLFLHGTISARINTRTISSEEATSPSTSLIKITPNFISDPTLHPLPTSPPVSLTKCQRQMCLFTRRSTDW